MTEPSPITLNTPDAGAPQAGDALRQAREQQGLTLEALASTLKVSLAKLEALEQGRFDSLPDANFVRALAMTVCRYLKLDPAPVLASLPAARAIPLTSDKPPLNQPFKDFRATGPLFDRHGPIEWSALLKFKWLAPAFLLLAAVGVYFLPEQISWPAWWPAHGVAVVSPAPSAASVAESASVAATVPEQPSGESSATASDVVSDAGQAVTASAASALAGASPSAPVSAGYSAAQALPSEPAAPVQLQADQAAWIEVVDGKGEKILNRELAEGETASVEGVPPLKLRIGNANHVQLSYKGQAVDLAPSSRGNVARLELK